MARISLKVYAQINLCTPLSQFLANLALPQKGLIKGFLPETDIQGTKRRTSGFNGFASLWYLLSVIRK